VPNTFDAALASTVSVALETVCVSAALVLPMKPGEVVLPLYVAVMLCEPALRALVEHVAWLLVSETDEQSGVTPSKKVTEPFELGFPAAEVTVAVNVTELPYTLGLPDVATVVAVVRRAKKLLPDDDPPAARVPVIGFASDVSA
jgi:hypothetical protein